MSALVTNPAKTQGGIMLARGYTFDPECSRTTHRLRLANRILTALGISPVWAEHAERCNRHPDNLVRVVHAYRESVGCNCNRPTTPTWPEHVTGRTFDLAYMLADEEQTMRGTFHQIAVAQAIEESLVSSREKDAS